MAQRVWVEPPRLSYDVWVSKHAVTDVLRHTDVSESGTKTLAALGMHAGLSAFVPHPGDRRVRLHCTAYVHERNVGWLCPLFRVGRGDPGRRCRSESAVPADFMTGEPDTSAHPVSGRREAADSEMLDVLGDLFVPVGSGPSPFTEADFAATLRAKPHPWVLATGGGASMTAEFAYTGSAPALDAVRRGMPNGAARRRRSAIRSWAAARCWLHLPAVTGRCRDRRQCAQPGGSRGMDGDRSARRVVSGAGGRRRVHRFPPCRHLPAGAGQVVWMMALRSRWACACLERAAGARGGRYRAPLESS
ncbi:MAG: hypothetical protein U0531_18085 [Dehalococcoidia bacterium]